MKINLEDVITQYAVLDKALLNLYATARGKWGHDIELKGVKSKHSRFDYALHSYVRSTLIFKLNTFWKRIKNAFMFRRRKRG